MNHIIIIFGIVTAAKPNRIFEILPLHVLLPGFRFCRVVYFIIMFLLLVTGTAGAQSFTDSKLPIIIINTDNGITIPDNPRILASMKIINRGEGQRNYVSDQNNTSFLNYQGRIKIEIRGSSSQTLPKKQYGFTTLEADDKTDAEISLLGMPEESDWILNGLGYEPSLIRDYLCYNLSRQIGQYASRTEYCEVIINGSYNGLYVLQEKIKQDPNRVNILKIASTDIAFPSLTGGYITKADKPNGDPVAWQMSSYIGTNDVSFIHELPKPENVKKEQQTYIKGEFMKLADAAAIQNNSLDDGIPSVIDIQSFVDFMLLNEFAANVDAYQYSTYFHKDRGGKLRAGPVWDMNLTFGNDLFIWRFDRSKTNTWQFSNNDNEGAKFWRDLYGNNLFRCLLRRRWKELTSPGNPFNQTEIESYIDATASNIIEASEREHQRWGTVGNLDANIDRIKTFIRDRTTWMNAQFEPLGDCLIPATPTLVITKIMYHPALPADPEFIEITNVGSSTVELTGICLSGTGFVFHFAPYSMILPGSSMIISNNTNSFLTNYGFVPSGYFFRSLSDSGMELILSDGYGTVIDRVPYQAGPPWPAVSGNGSWLNLSDNESDNSDPLNWIADGSILTSVGAVSEYPVLSISPNPASSMVHIISTMVVHQIEVLHLNGSVAIKAEPGSIEFDLDLSNLPPGLYLVKAISGNRQSIQKIIKL